MQSAAHFLHQTHHCGENPIEHESGTKDNLLCVNEVITSDHNPTVILRVMSHSKQIQKCFHLMFSLFGDFWIGFLILLYFPKAIMHKLSLNEHCFHFKRTLCLSVFTLPFTFQCGTWQWLMDWAFGGWNCSLGDCYQMKRSWSANGAVLNKAITSPTHPRVLSQATLNKEHQRAMDRNDTSFTPNGPYMRILNEKHWILDKGRPSLNA